MGNSINRFYLLIRTLFGGGGGVDAFLLTRTKNIVNTSISIGIILESLKAWQNCLVKRD